MIHRCTHCGWRQDLAPAEVIGYIHIDCANAGFYNEMLPLPENGEEPND